MFHLNYLGVERTTTGPVVQSVADIHLVYMPYSHSVATAVGAAVLAWLVIEWGSGRAALGRAVGLGIVSHLVLDLATHGHDVTLGPGRAWPMLGLGLYSAAPLAAFAIEMVYGLLCWRVYRGGRGLRSLLLVIVVLVQIVVTLVLVGVLARPARPRAAWDRTAA